MRWVHSRLEKVGSERERVNAPSWPGAATHRVLLAQKLSIYMHTNESQRAVQKFGRITSKTEGGGENRGKIREEKDFLAFLLSSSLFSLQASSISFIGSYPLTHHLLISPRTRLQAFLCIATLSSLS